MFSFRAPSPKAFVNCLWSLALLIFLQTAAYAQAPIHYPLSDLEYSTDQPSAYKVQSTPFDIHPGAEAHDFMWSKHLKIGDVSATDSSRYILGAWMSEHTISYDAGIVSFDVYRGQTSLLGRRQWTEASASVDFTNLPIVGDTISNIFDSISFERPFNETGKRGHRCRESSLSWATRPLTWGNVGMTFEGAYDTHTSNFASWIRVVISKH
ncbi:MAG TPA: hypothetical protein VEZ90_14570 [Blastocatellia bacterium]|nr:hypothetical protein [Blastocatellia bacterium]